MVTRSRGEIRHICSPKVTSSTETPIGDSKGLHSPRFSEKAYSPRVSELRQVQSPLSGGKGPYSPRTGEARPSKLGQPAPHSSSKQNMSSNLWCQQQLWLLLLQLICQYSVRQCVVSFHLCSFALWVVLSVTLAVSTFTSLREVLY